MDKVIGAIICALVVLLVVGLMWRSWRRRARRDSALGGYPLPADAGTAIVDTEVLYVASTPAGEPLDRLAVSGLSFRGAARIVVEGAGVTLRVAGEEAVFMPAERLTGARTASWAIDRGVEPGGLITIEWAARETGATDGRPVESYLRARYEGDHARIIEAIDAIASARAASADAATQTTESEA